MKCGWREPGTEFQKFILTHVELNLKNCMWLVCAALGSVSSVSIPQPAALGPASGPDITFSADLP